MWARAPVRRRGICSRGCGSPRPPVVLVVVPVFVTCTATGHRLVGAATAIGAASGSRRSGSASHGRAHADWFARHVRAHCWAARVLAAKAGLCAGMASAGADTACADSPCARRSPRTRAGAAPGRRAQIATRCCSVFAGRGYAVGGMEVGGRCRGFGRRRRERRRAGRIYTPGNQGRGVSGHREV